MLGRYGLNITQNNGMFMQNFKNISVPLFLRLLIFRSNSAEQYYRVAKRDLSIEKLQ